MRLARAVTLLLLVGALVSCSVAQEAAPIAPEPFSFVVFGDCQPGEREWSPVMMAIATEVGQLDVAFAIGTGDYINGSSNQSTVRRQWEGFFHAIAPLQAHRTIPVALAPGNHDIMGMSANAQIFVEHFKKLYRSFDYGGCHFILLNTETAGSAGRIDGQQLEWLKQDLAASADARFTFVALHRPLFPVDGHVGSSLDLHPEERDALHRLFVDSGVDCVFSGHEHLYNHQEKDGIHYFIAGGAGGPLYVRRAHGGFHHYLLVSVGEDEYTVEPREVTATQGG